mgnify:CR=1 FL=1
MYHHLKHALVRSSRDIEQYCNLNNWLTVSNIVDLGIENKKTQENISLLIDSAIYNHPNLRYSSDNENRPLISMVENRNKNSNFNKNSMIIINQIDNKEYLIDCLDTNFRTFIPKFNDRLTLGSIVAGIYYQDQEKAKECFKHFVKCRLNAWSSGLNWFKNDILKNLKLTENWDKKNFESDLKELYYNSSSFKMVAFFDLDKTFENLNQSIKSLIDKDVVETKQLRRTEEYKNFISNLDNTIKLCENPEINNLIKKTTKKLKI